jgi:Lon protease-like protein
MSEGSGTGAEVSLQELPIFPLPDAVLFPGAFLPLHVLEPRYLSLLDAVCRGDRRMGIARLLPGWEAEYFGAPAVDAIFGVGEVLTNEERPDGTHDIVLRGLFRARIVVERRTSLPYRTVHAITLPDEVSAGDGARLERELGALRQLFLSLAARAGEGGAAAANAVLEAPPESPAIIELIAGAIGFPAAWRQGLLAERRAAVRAHVLNAALERIVAELPAGAGGAEG